MRRLIPLLAVPALLLAAPSCSFSDNESSLPALVLPPGEMRAQRLVIMRRVSEKGVGETIGTLGLTNSRQGLKIIPDLRDLPSGDLGFHVHENGDCGTETVEGTIVPAGAAGAHYDPDSTNTHAGPHGEGHKGDLPALKVGPTGTAKEILYAPRLTVSDVVNRSFVIHRGGDTYRDTPPLGGGGLRIACGVVRFEE